MKYLESATYWTQGALDEFGNPTWNGPNVTKCRWEVVAELFITQDGRQESSQSRVYLDPMLSVGDKIYRGKSGASDPPNDALIVKQVQEVRNVKGTKRERKVIL